MYYHVTKSLGKGAFGFVFLIEDQNGEKYAVKRIQKASKQLSWEFEILKEIEDCPYCVQLKEVFYTMEKGMTI